MKHPQEINPHTVLYFGNQFTYIYIYCMYMGVL